MKRFFLILTIFNTATGVFFSWVFVLRGFETVKLWEVYYGLVSWITAFGSWISFKLEKEIVDSQNERE